MSEPRICPECGSDIYQASHYEDLAQARDRHWRKNQQQAIEILRLKLEVAQLKDERRLRGQKVERQRRVIKRLEERLRSAGLRPHEDKPLGEGPPTSPSPAHDAVPGTSGMGPPDPATQYLNPRGLRKMRRRAKKLGDKKQ
jgi:hypothetical protein